MVPRCHHPVRLPFLVGVVLMVNGAWMAAQTTNGSSPGAPSTLHVESTLVLVPTLVLDRHGSIVYGLHANDFILTDDGVAQPLTLHPDTDNEPLALVVVMEAGAAKQMSGWQPGSRKEPPNRFRQLPLMIEAIAGNVTHKVALVGFDSKPHLLLKFTPDMTRIAPAIHDYSEEDSDNNGAAILDSIGFAVDLLSRQPPQYRRAILLLSETNDRGSLLPLADALRAITNTNTTIFSLAYSSGATAASRYGSKHLPTKRAPNRVDVQDPDVQDPAIEDAASGLPATLATSVLRSLFTGVTFENPTPYQAGGCIAKDPSANSALNQGTALYDCAGDLLPPLALAKMAAIAAVDGIRQNIPETVAKLTGGEYFRFNDQRSLDNALATVANHVPNRYVLSFQPQSPHPGPHALHLQVKDYDKLDISTRTSYWADSPAATPH